MIKDVITIARRELSAYFNAPVAYVFSVVFLFVICGTYMATFFLSGLCSMRSMFSILPLIFIVFIPALTMRLWAEERKNGTLALLFSLPASSASLCLGKFLAAFLFGTLAVLGTLTIPLMLAFLGNPDPGPILGGYLGTALLTAELLSLGMAVSALFTDQIVAFILTLVLGFASFLLGTDFTASLVDGWLPGLGTFLKDTVGIPCHFNSFAKGVIDAGDVIFFVSYTALFLVTNILILEGHLKMRKTRGSTLGIALLFGIVVLLNGIVKDVTLPRADLTEEGLYTISAGTKRVLERLKVPVTVTYYVTSRDRLPTPMKDIARDVKDIMEELAKLSPKFSFRVVDPMNIPDKIPDLQKKGIMPFSAQTIEQDTVNIKRIYSSIALAYLDKKEEIIPQIVPESLGNLEYELVSRIYRLTLDHKPKVVIWAPHRELDLQTMQFLQQMGRPVPPSDDYQTLAQILSGEGYQIVRQNIDKNHPLPEDTRLLILLSPQELNERQRYEIYRFLRSGGSVILAAQALEYSYDDGGPQGLAVTASQLPIDNVNSLISPLGIEISKNMLFDQRHLPLQITSRQRIGMFTALVQTPVNYPMQIQVLSDQMNQHLSITNRVQGLLYLWGSSLKLNGEKIRNLGLKATTLFNSSPASWERPYHFGTLTEQDLNPPEMQQMKSKPLAVFVEGLFPDLYKGKPVPKWPSSGNSNDEKHSENPEKNIKQENRQAAQAKPGKMIVIGCSKMFTDTVIGALGNTTLALNCTDALALGEDLIHVRSKTQIQRFIPPVPARAKIFWRALVIFLVPFLWTTYGIIRALKRKKARANCKFAVG